MAGNAAIVRARQALYGRFLANVHQSGESCSCAVSKGVIQG